MGISKLEFLQMEERVSRNKKQPRREENAADVEYEIPLHREILMWADAQWPPVPYIYANPTKKVTIGKGIHDITLFIGEDFTLCVECKSRDGKLKPDQRIWRKMMEMRGITVHEVRNMEHFKTLIDLKKFDKLKFEL